MIAHLEAIRARLASAGAPVHLLAPEPGSVPPYVLVGGPANAAGSPRLGGERSRAWTTHVRIHAVAGTPVGATLLLARVREALSGALDVAGRDATIRFERSEFVGLDETATIPGANRHPALGVDTYLLASSPVSQP